MKHINIVLTGAALMLSASACSLLRPKTASADAPATSIGAVSGRPAREVRNPVPAPPKTAGERPDQTTLCGGRWYIAAIGAETIEEEDDAPYIDFEAGTGRFYASDGCNILNGDYLLRTDGALVFSNVLSTMRYCPDSEYSASIASRLGSGDMLYVDTRRIGQDTYLYLRTADDHVVMTLRRLNMEFLNGNWKVVSIDGENVDDDECNVFFDIAELRIHGNTGCNYFNGRIYISPNRSNALDLSDMAVTHKACPNSDREMRMMVALESTTSAIAGTDDNTVLLLDSSGREMIVLRRM